MIISSHKQCREFIKGGNNQQFTKKKKQIKKKSLILSFGCVCFFWSTFGELVSSKHGGWYCSPSLFRWKNFCYDSITLNRGVIKAKQGCN